MKSKVITLLFPTMLLMAIVLLVAAEPASSQCTRGCGQPFVGISPGSLAFAAQSVGANNGVMTITVKSLGIAPVLFTGFATSGPFSQTNDCPRSLPRPRTCHIRVTFRPKKAGTFKGSITIRDNASPARQVVTLSGSGVAAAGVQAKNANSASAELTPGEQSSAEPEIKAHRRYRLIDFGTLGGPQSYVNIPPASYSRVLNNQGAVAGWADTPISDPFPDFCFDEDCFVSHAFRGRQRDVRDLGALPGGGSSQGNWISETGLIAGISQNGETDPLVPGFPELRAVLWKNNRIVDLGTLDGGYESIASAVNSSGQVVGLATNTIPDADSMVGIGYQTRAFLWHDGKMQDLGTLGTGTDAVALLVNERGQVAGDSYNSAQPSDACAQAEVGTLSTGAFLWDHGTMIDLGNFGGTCTFAFALNNRGEVAGGSRLAGDLEQHPFLWNGKTLIDLGTFGGGLGTAVALNDAGHSAGWATYPGDEVVHAAFWRRSKLEDLGTLAGDAFSLGYDINGRDQVVGVSTSDFSDLTKYRAFLWQPGEPMRDLNELIPSSALQLVLPETINDRGEIAGIALDNDGNQHAFLLVPCGENDPLTIESSQAATSAIKSGHSPLAMRPYAQQKGLVPGRPGQRSPVRTFGFRSRPKPSEQE